MSDEPKRILLNAGQSKIRSVIKCVSFHPNTTARKFYINDEPENLGRKVITGATKEESSGCVLKSPTRCSIEKRETNSNKIKTSEIIGFICCLPFLIYISCISLLCPCLKHVISKFCRKCKTKRRRRRNHIKDINNIFIDTDFSPNNDSINMEEFNTDEIEWLSVTEIYTEKKLKFNLENINIKNIIDGQINKHINRRALSAIVSLCLYPHLIKKLFLRKFENDSDNTYRFKLFDAIKQKWKRIKIDDSIPCNIYSKKPLFNYPKCSNESWINLLEKSMAKFCGDYCSLNETDFAWTLQALTGHKMSIYANTSNQRDSWIKGYIKYNTVLHKNIIDALNVQQQTLTSDTNQKYKIHFEDDAKNYFSTKILWKILNKAFDSGGLIIGMRCTNESFPIELNKCQELDVNLICGHSYTILQIKEINRFRFIEIHNPWNTFKWNGEWSNQDPIWEQYTYIFNELKPDFNQNSKFWIELNEFISLFNVIYICHKIKRMNNHKNNIILNVNYDQNIHKVTDICCNKCFHFWCKCVSCKLMYPNICGKWFNRENSKQKTKSKYLTKV
eukprot:281675_1